MVTKLRLVYMFVQIPNVLKLNSEINFYDCDIGISTPSGEFSLPKSKSKSLRFWCFHAFIEGENFQKLKQFSENTCLIIFRTMFSGERVTFLLPNIPEINAVYLKSLKLDLKKFSNGSTKETVKLHVGEESEIVNKAVLCLRSPVFAKMFENEMREQKENIVVITDIEMPVLKSLVSFLYSGVLPDFDFQFLCDLYYAADKYSISELQLACTRSLVNKPTSGNLYRLLQVALLHNYGVLKFATMALISGNKKTLILTSGWGDLMLHDPERALEASTFFDTLTSNGNIFSPWK